MTLDFDTLRKANVDRNNLHFHSLDKWTLTDWCCALAGEAGEACNIAKKLRRLETAPQWKKDESSLALFELALAKELADVVIYADLLAARLGVDLGEVIRAKFNETSDQINSEIKL